MDKNNSIDAESPLFLYDQVKIRIKEMIATGELAPGTKLPNEKELCDTFETSRITIRRALKELENEGVIEIIHGKGTFVKSIKQQLHILNLKGFTEGLAIGEQHFTKEVLVKKVETADEELMEIFKRNEPFEVLKLIRLIKDENALFSVDYAYLPTDIYPGISEKVKDNVSTFKLIHDVYGIKFRKAKKDIEVTKPTQEVSTLLEIAKVEPVIQIRKVISEENDVPVHYSKYYLKAESVNFFIDIDMSEDD
ncbi:GntR family transcriptional regulator [Mesobacillus maritimus]|uniref:GntR family transcriptional regulator n=1 Tax=Mesobacillus maritimus TaxID=1643336 RepID=UPI00384F02BD